MIKYAKELPDSQQAQEVIKAAFVSTIITQRESGLPIPEKPTPDFMYEAWKKGMSVIYTARDGDKDNEIVSLIMAGMALTVFGEKIMIISSRFTVPDYRKKGINKELSGLIDEYFRSLGAVWALSVVVPGSPGHLQMQKLGAVYPLLQGFRKL